MAWLILCWVLVFVYGSWGVDAMLTFESWPNQNCGDEQLVRAICKSRSSGKYCYPCSSGKYVLCSALGGTVESCEQGQQYDYHSRFCVDETNRNLVTCPDLPCPVYFNSSSSLAPVVLLPSQRVRSPTDGGVSLDVLEYPLEEAGDFWIADALPGRCILGRAVQVNVSCPYPLPRSPKTWVVTLGNISAIGTSMLMLVPMILPPVEALCGDLLRILSYGDPDATDATTFFAHYHPSQLGDAPRQINYQQDWFCPTPAVLSSSTGVRVLSPPLLSNTVRLQLLDNMTHFWLLDPTPGHCASGMVAKVTVSCPSSSAPQSHTLPWSTTTGPLPAISAACGDSITVSWRAAEGSALLSTRHALVMVMDPALVHPVYAEPPWPIPTSYRGWPVPKCDDSSLMAAVCSRQLPGKYCYTCDSAKYIECGDNGTALAIRSCKPGYVYDMYARFCVAQDAGGRLCPAWPMPALYSEEVMGLSKKAAITSAVPFMDGTFNITVPQLDPDTSWWVINCGPGHAQVGELLQVFVSCTQPPPPPQEVPLRLYRESEDFGPVGKRSPNINASCGDRLLGNMPLGPYVPATEIRSLVPELYNGPFLLGSPQQRYSCPSVSGDYNLAGSKHLTNRTYSGAHTWKVPSNLQEVFVLDATNNHCINGMIFKVTITCPPPPHRHPLHLNISWRFTTNLFLDLNLSCGDSLHFEWGGYEVGPYSMHAVRHDVTLVDPSQVTPAYLHTPAQLTARRWPNARCDDDKIINQTCAVRPAGRYCYPCALYKFVSCTASGSGTIERCDEGRVFDLLLGGCWPSSEALAPCTAFPCPTIVGSSTYLWSRVIASTKTYSLTGLMGAEAQFVVPNVNMQWQWLMNPDPSSQPDRIIYVADGVPGRCPLGAAVALISSCTNISLANTGTGVSHDVDLGALLQDDSTLQHSQRPSLRVNCGDTIRVRGPPDMLPIAYISDTEAKSFLKNNVPWANLNAPLLLFPPPPVYSCPPVSGVRVLAPPSRAGAFLLHITDDLPPEFWMLDPAPGNCRNGMIFKVTARCPAPEGAAPSLTPLHWVMTGNVHPDQHVTCGDTLNFTWGGGEMNMVVDHNKLGEAVRVRHGVALADSSAGVYRLRGAAAGLRDALASLDTKMRQLYGLVRGV